MRPFRPGTVPQRRFVWLLWLALLLPMAQASAAWHALSHTRPDASGAADGKQALHQNHCDLCLIAATVSGGALAGEPVSPPHSTARHELPRTASSSVWQPAPTRAYDSRAPPLASH
jgi:hypothetical protein